MAPGEAARAQVSSFRPEDVALEPIDVSGSVLDGRPEWRAATPWRAADGGLVVGCFRSSPGRFSVSQTRDEAIFVRAGHVIVSGEDGSTVDCRAGDVIALTRDTTYVFDIREALENVYVTSP
ncbi:MAG TPA: cupin domain-containing protein [Solirubrobacterales bacterium]|nr:cupin domain-containing protein [Solirubrobacterales bacterium]